MNLRRTRPWAVMAPLVLLGGCETAPSSDAGSDAGLVPPDTFVPMDDASMPDAGPVRADPIMPVSNGPCPDLSSPGTVTLTGPTGATRTAQIWVSDAASTMDGPLVFYFHGTGGSPSEATYALGAAVTEITDAGGIVVALTHDPAAGVFPWFLTSNSGLNDVEFADEVVACASETIGIDDHRIHAVGFSAGALHVGKMAFLRASYLASVVTYSGGLLATRPPMTDAPDARVAAMALFGGPDDVVGVSFAVATRNFVNALRRDGHFGFSCDHGMGHAVPRAAVPFAWQFMSAHPYGAQPPAYRDALPVGFYPACAL